MKPDTRMAYKSTILRSGLVLIGFPAVMSTVCLLGLNQVWGWTSQSAEQETKYSRIVGLTDLILDDLMNYNSEFISYSWTKKGKLHVRAERERREILERLDTVAKLAVGDPDMEAMNDQVRKLSMAALNTSAVEALKGKTGEDFVTRNMKQGMQVLTMTKDCFLFSREAQMLLNEQRFRLLAMRPEQQGFAHAMKSIALFGFGTSFAVTLLVVLAFSKFFRKRIERLMESARSLSGPSPDHPPIPGSDELAYLSSCLDDIRKQLAEAAEKRQAILSMVAHDVRSPLMASQLSIDLLNKMNPCTQLESAKESIKSTVTFVNDLLAEGKFELSESTERLAASPARATGKGFQISQKVLLIALAPLVLQSAWLFWINQEVAQTERFANAERQRQQLILLTNSLSLRIVEAGAAAALYLATTKDAFRTLGSQQLVEAQKDLAELKVISENEPARKAYVDALADAVQSAVTNWKDLEVKKAYDDVGATFQRAEVLKIHAQKRVTLANKEKEQIEKERVLLDQDRLKHKQVEQSVQCILWAAIAGNIALSFILLWIFTKDVSSRLTRLTQKVRRMPDVLNDPPIGGRDELSQLDQALTQAASQLKQAAAERLSVLSALTTQMREPLVAAQESLNDLTDKIDDEELPAAQANIQRVLDLISDLMDIRIIESGNLSLNRQTVEVSQVVAGSISTVKSLAADKDVSIVDRTESHNISVDSARIVQVLNNILTNAIKFSPQGSTVEVASKCHEGAVTIAVSDTGPGIDPEMAERIFDPRFQIKRDGKGFGLGLAIAKSIVESHGGKISIDTAARQGSRFLIELPAQEKQFGEDSAG